MSTDRRFWADALRALDAADRGTFSALDALSCPAASTVETQAWADAVEAARAFYGRGTPVPPVSPAAFVSASAEARRAAARACAYRERLAVLRFDATGLTELAEVHEQLSQDQSAAKVSLASQAARMWGRVLRGEVADAEDEGRALHAAALRDQAAETVIEATIMRALAALGRGDQESAVAHARRGARMAHAEGLVAYEWWAGLVLARVRRVSGKPHLALQIAESLARVVPPSWSGWLTWELVLGGADLADWPVKGTPDPADKAGQAAQALLDLLAAAREGSRERFGEAAARLEQTGVEWGPLREEAATVVGALDPSAPPTRSLERWRRGEEPQVPFGLQGLCTSSEVDDAPSKLDRALAYMVVEPGQPGRRMLRAALPMVPGGVEAERAFAARRSGHRTDVGLAVLASAGPDGLSIDLFFRQVWGFAFVRRVHQGPLDLAVHRMRKLVEPLARVERGDNWIGLRVDRPMVLPDPRCHRSTAEHVLRLLGKHGVLRARQAAEALQVPLRTLQAALAQLVSDGACQVVGGGREVRYQVLDTTFPAVLGGIDEAR